MKFYTFLFLLALPACIRAEIISLSGTDVRPVNSNLPLFRLAANTRVECAPMQGSMYKIMVKGWFHAEDVNDDHQLMRGKKIYDSTGNLIGQSYQDITFERYFNDEGTFISAELFGLIPSYAIKPESIVENDLATIFRTKVKQLTFQDFEQHFKKFEYRQWEGTGDFSSNIYMESRVNDLNPGGRILLIFYRQELAAIIYSRSITVPYYESQAESQPYKIYYMKKMKDAEKEKLASFYFNRIKRP